MRVVVQCPNPDVIHPGNTQGPVHFTQSLSIESFPTQQERHEETGRALWKELHASDMTPTQFKNWLARVPNTSTCGSCQQWAIDWLSIPGNEPDYANWLQWSVRFHNAINAKLTSDDRPREQWTIERSIAHYRGR